MDFLEEAKSRHQEHMANRNRCWHAKLPSEVTEGIDAAAEAGIPWTVIAELGKEKNLISVGSKAVSQHYRGDCSCLPKTS